MEVKLNLRKISLAIYSTYLVNKFGLKLKFAKSPQEKKALRVQFAKTILGKLNIDVKITNKEKVPKDGQYLLISNHRSIIDPTIIELALEDTLLNGLWVAKKELYNSFFFGLFVRNGGCILLDRESSNMTSFFKRTKEVVKQGYSIQIFPEGTRNKNNTKIEPFKEGCRIIALKNRLDILPVYIRTNANEVLKKAINTNKKDLLVEIEIGDLISYKDKSDIEEVYKNQFNI